MSSRTRIDYLHGCIMCGLTELILFAVRLLFCTSQGQTPTGGGILKLADCRENLLHWPLSGLLLRDPAQACRRVSHATASQDIPEILQRSLA